MRRECGEYIHSAMITYVVGSSPHLEGWSEWLQPSLFDYHLNLSLIIEVIFVAFYLLDVHRG